MMLIFRLGVITIFGLITVGCGVVPTTLLENLGDEGRANVFSTKSSADLCDAYNHPEIKHMTEAQLREVLLSRGVNKCDARNKTRYLNAPNAKHKNIAETLKILDVVPGPKRIDVVGIVPSETSSSEYKSKTSSWTNRLLVGGYELWCSPIYFSGYVDQVTCIIESDTTSNIRKYEVLVDGFTKKFGAPDFTDKTLVQNKLGASFDNHKTTWVDSVGNQLVIESRYSKVDQGLMRILSARFIIDAKLNADKKDKKRKF